MPEFSATQGVATAEAPIPSPEITVVSPTFNEIENAPRLIAAVAEALQGSGYEILIADDNSPDLTWKKVEEMGEADGRIRVLRRLANPGLSRSVIDAFADAKGEYVACIDCDLQHDPAILPQMLKEMEAGADLVVGSRYVAGGGVGDWNWIRRMESKIATKMAQWVLGIKISDPMSGYFVMRKSDFLRIREKLVGEGFKILLEIAAHLKPKHFVEVPYTFRTRTAGESKLSGKVVIAYLRQLARLLSVTLPTRFLKFALVGASGIIVNLAIMAVLLHAIGLKDWRASAIASVAAMFTNYVLNNVWTFQDRIRKGRRFLSGFVTYFFASVTGLAATTGTYVVLTRLLEPMVRPSFANLVRLGAQFIGIMIGCLFNYEINKLFTWRATEDPSDATASEAAWDGASKSKR